MQVLKSFNCKVLIADVEPHSGCLAYESLKRLLSEGISAIIMYSPFGNLPDYEKFANISYPKLTSSIIKGDIDKEIIDLITIKISKKISLSKK